MNKDEWNKLTNKEIVKLSDEEFLKHLIKFNEERYIWYKKALEDLYLNYAGLGIRAKKQKGR